MDRPQLTAQLLTGRDYPRLKARLAGEAGFGELKEAWAGLSPLDRLAAFKLLGPSQAIAFFSELGAEDQYFLFCGFEPGSIAPLTEDLPPGRAALFERLGQEAYREMSRRLEATLAAPGGVGAGDRGRGTAPAAREASAA